MKTTKQKYATFKRHARKLHYMWVPAQEAWKAANVSWGTYQCVKCGGLFKRKECQLDHIEPVEPKAENYEVNSILYWTVYFCNLFCTVDEYQVLCKECHNKKTKEENEMRRQNK